MSDKDSVFFELKGLKNKIVETKPILRHLHFILTTLQMQTYR
ncbi:MAG: hypothetical protein H6Q14_2649 [Bacteroidetes bacterium]|nr:hypothetical protein [Bacteroidota bacterium]